MLNLRHFDMTTRKKVTLGVIAIVIVAVAYYLLSPIWRVKQADEPSPLAGQPPTLNLEPPTSEVKDALTTMDAETKAEFMKQMEMMKDVVMEKMEAMPASSPRLLAQGVFHPRAHEVAGRALLIEADGKKTVRFEDFETINGPDLRIYLSADLSNDDFIDLGPIRATKGNVNYELLAGVDTAKYNNVLIWCRAFRVLFSYAELL